MSLKVTPVPSFLGRALRTGARGRSAAPPGALLERDFQWRPGRRRLLAFRASAEEYRLPSLTDISQCPGFGGDEVGYDLDEDCLMLNVIRPKGIVEGSNVPVGVWIYGGGYSM